MAVEGEYCCARGGGVRAPPLDPMRHDRLRNSSIATTACTRSMVCLWCCLVGYGGEDPRSSVRMDV